MRVTWAALGASVVMAEGGPSLNGALVAAGLVDELCLTVSPHLVAGTSARVTHGAVSALTAHARPRARGGRLAVPPLPRSGVGVTVLALGLGALREQRRARGRSRRLRRIPYRRSRSAGRRPRRGCGADRARRGRPARSRRRLPLEPQALLDLTGESLRLVDQHRTALRHGEHSGHELGAVERLSFARALHHHKGRLLEALERREAAPARQAFRGVVGWPTRRRPSASR